jgi:hypothetical protein
MKNKAKTKSLKIDFNDKDKAVKLLEKYVKNYSSNKPRGLLLNESLREFHNTVKKNSRNTLIAATLFFIFLLFQPLPIKAKAFFGLIWSTSLFSFLFFYLKTLNVPPHKDNKETNIWLWKYGNLLAIVHASMMLCNIILGVVLKSKVVFLSALLFFLYIVGYFLIMHFPKLIVSSLYTNTVSIFLYIGRFGLGVGMAAIFFRQIDTLWCFAIIAIVGILNFMEEMKGQQLEPDVKINAAQAHAIQASKPEVLLLTLNNLLPHNLGDKAQQIYNELLKKGDYATMVSLNRMLSSNLIDKGNKFIFVFLGGCFSIFLRYIFDPLWEGLIQDFKKADIEQWLCIVFNILCNPK